MFFLPLPFWTSGEGNGIAEPLIFTKVWWVVCAHSLIIWALLCQDGIPLAESVEVDNVPALISHEQQQVNAILHRLRRLETMLLSSDPVSAPV